MKKRRKWILFFAPAFLAAVVFYCFYSGILLLNNPSMEDYPIRGVDVSSYQGEIDWTVLSDQNISFAFLKATEGSGYVDPFFAKNLTAAQKTPLRVGAYHFFSYDSPGESQAVNFITHVPSTPDMLPPVVDVEFYGDKERNPPDRESVQRELTVLLSRLRSHYGMTPILYATEKSYSLFLSGDYPDHDIWIRNVLTAPSLLDGRAWTFWQYTNRGRLKGYNGVEPYIDLNVFRGSPEFFKTYPNEGGFPSV